jgi:hypothetical protein
MADPALDGLSEGSEGAVAARDPAKLIAPPLFTPDRRGEGSMLRGAEL